MTTRTRSDPDTEKLDAIREVTLRLLGTLRSDVQDLQLDATRLLERIDDVMHVLHPGGGPCDDNDTG